MIKNLHLKKNTITNKTRYLLALEYGVILSETAKNQGVELTEKMVKKAEAMFLSECETSTDTELAVNMIPNILSIFEPK